MDKMDKNFALYEESFALKELGFNEECFWWYGFEKYLRKDRIGTSTNYSYFLENKSCSAPLYSQAFRWFREKYNLEGWVTPLVDEQGFVFKYQSRFHKEGFSIAVVGDYDLKEQAELECLKKLIEIVKNNE
jgi:hypothetical protein